MARGTRQGHPAQRAPIWRPKMSKIPFLKKNLIDDEHGNPLGVDFVLANGVTIKARLADYDEKIRARLMQHGLSQKVGDATSSAKGDYAFAEAAMEAVESSLRRAEWNQGRTPAHTDLIVAMVLVFKKTEEEVKFIVDRLNEDGVKEMKKIPAIKATMMELKAVRERKKVKEATSVNLDELVKKYTSEEGSEEEPEEGSAE